MNVMLPREHADHPLLDQALDLALELSSSFLAELGPGGEYFQAPRHVVQTLLPLILRDEYVQLGVSE